MGRTTEYQNNDQYKQCQSILTTTLLEITDHTGTAIIPSFYHLPNVNTI